MKLTDIGNYTIRIDDGIFVIRPQNDISKIKERAFKECALLANGSYIIEDGVIVLKGELHNCDYIAGGPYDTLDLELEEGELHQYLDKYFIDPKHVLTVSVKTGWFWKKKTKIKKSIERGYYLRQKSVPHTYTTTLFRIIG